MAPSSKSFILGNSSSMGNSIPSDIFEADNLKVDFLEAIESEVGIRALYEMEAQAYRIKPSRSSDYYVKLSFPTISNHWKYIFPIFHLN